MAIVLKYDVIKSSDFIKLIFTETTGVKPTVSDGYGAPDMAVNDITAVTVRILFPHETTTIDHTYTNSVVNTTFDLLSADFQNKTFVDGYYTISYSVTDGTTTIETSKEFFFYNQTECCISKSLSSLSSCKNCFEKEDLMPMIAKMYLEASKDAFFRCGLKNKANELLDLASKICSEKCNCGCGEH